ncbi:MAG TPA: ABC transporter substrate-binding protein [Chloroflexota bacterium]
MSTRAPFEIIANRDHTSIFNADISLLDDRGAPIPYLVEALPQLRSEGWQVFADGRLLTVYHLRPNLTWHDGSPLSAEDFIFGYRVYSAPEIGQALQAPFVAMEAVEASDARTISIRWKRPYPDAAYLAGRSLNFPPLPRHLLEAAFATDPVDKFVAHPYWTREFVGVGPYRLVNWEPGSFIDAAAFDGHALGRPKIERIKIMFIPDANTALANILSGEVEFGSVVLSLPQAVTLQQEWASRQGGIVFYQLSTWHALAPQFRPGFTSPTALLDVRVRKALAQAIDRPALNEAINAGIALEADYILPPNSAWGPEVQRGAVKYGYDLQRSEQLMREAGFDRGSDGIHSSSAGGPLIIELTAGAGQGAQEAAALANGWEKAGFKIEQRVVPPALTLDPETSNSYSGMIFLTQLANERTAVGVVPGNLPMPENGWRGGARVSWTNPDYTRLVDQFSSTLDRAQRGEQMAQMARLFTEDAAAISLNFPPLTWATAASLTGPHEAPPEAYVFWNVHQWELR